MDKPNQPVLTLDLLQKSERDDVNKELLKIENTYREKQAELRLIHLEQDGRIALTRKTKEISQEQLDQVKSSQDYSRIKLKDEYRAMAEDVFTKNYPNIPLEYNENEKDVSDFLNGYNTAYNLTFDDPNTAKKIYQAIKEKDGDYDDGFRYGVIKAYEEIREINLSKEYSKEVDLDMDKDKGLDRER